MGSVGLQSCDVLAITDETVLGVSAVLNAVGKVVTQSQGGLEKTDPVIITQASSLGQLPVETSTIDFVICFCSSVEFPNGKFLEEISRVMKPGGTILICKTSRPVGQVDKVASSPERKLLMAGFLEIQTVQMNTSASSEDDQSLGVQIKAKKASWKIGSSFSIKKTTKSLPKIQIDDDMDLIDEDSLLTEEDLKKPILPMPSVGDCEVGSTRKACKNCSCGRAEAEAKVVKLGPTDVQLNNPQSACGSCGLGDAFRCGTCPYKGLPPFKLGEKVSLPSNFLAADI